ncbi:MAG: hypothetical protein ACD_23C01224G0002 [uncultured bacterium]|uniref:MFS transporter n=1 Tax=Candidatus Afipia apatlaquensis TaxID=2712852 RepID=A0A7C9RIG3_9BRAD|nr:MAG: hypothetical protein ACD_23C01224G0002 [uncultured bacterium]MBS4004992.1 MFS transporter [Afipia sp.]NGX97602.1 MFS transporter [Candidatus Afipia apatlaquensis]RTL75996.1 MAG: MFS transporter [Bradyrhizobiaceae bacterium]
MFQATPRFVSRIELIVIEYSESAKVKTSEGAYSWVVACLSLLMTSLSFGAVTSVPILMKPMSDELFWSRGKLSLVHTAALVGAAVGSLVIGYASDRMNFLRLALLAAISIGAGLLIASRADEFWQIALAYGILVGGIGQGTFFSPITAAASRWFDHNRTYAIAIVTCGQGVGGIVVPLILRDMALHNGWRSALLNYGIASTAVIGLASLVFIREPPITSASIEPETEQQPSTNWFTYYFAMAHFAVCSIGSFLFIGHFMIFCEESAIDPFTSSALMSSTLGATIVSRLAAGYLLKSIDSSRVILASNLIIAIGIMVVAFSEQSVFLISTGAAIFGIGFGAAFPAYGTSARANFPARQFGFWLATMWCLSFICAGFGSWAGGLFRDALGNYKTGFAFASGLILAGSLVAQPLLYATRKQQFKG